MLTRQLGESKSLNASLIALGLFAAVVTLAGSGLTRRPSDAPAQVEALLDQAGTQLTDSAKQNRITAVENLVEIATAVTCCYQQVVSLLCDYLRSPRQDDAEVEAAILDVLSNHAHPDEWGHCLIDLHEAVLTENADFSGKAFTINASGTRFGGCTYFSKATLGTDSTFDNATFTSYAAFRGATFAGPARFQGARFSGYANFRETRFAAGANFQGAAFSGYADFENTDWLACADFTATAFTGYTDFRKAICHANALFDRATFAENTNFECIIFDGQAAFANTFFNHGVYFGGATFADGRFQGATFCGPTTFDNAVFSRDCHSTQPRFPDTMPLVRDLPEGARWDDAHMVTHRSSPHRSVDR